MSVARYAAVALGTVLLYAGATVRVTVNGGPVNILEEWWRAKARLADSGAVHFVRCVQSCGVAMNAWMNGLCGVRLISSQSFAAVLLYGLAASALAFAARFGAARAIGVAVGLAEIALLASVARWPRTSLAAAPFGVVAFAAWSKVVGEMHSELPWAMSSQAWERVVSGGTLLSVCVMVPGMLALGLLIRATKSKEIWWVGLLGWVVDSVFLVIPSVALPQVLWRVAALDAHAADYFPEEMVRMELVSATNIGMGGARVICWVACLVLIMHSLAWNALLASAFRQVAPTCARHRHLLVLLGVAVIFVAVLAGC